MMSETQQLPTSLSAYDKMSGFEPEALHKRDLMMEDKFVKCRVKDECNDMLNLMKDQTNSAERRKERVGEPWFGEKTVSLEDKQIKQEASAQRAEAEARIKKTITELANVGVQTVRVDIAIGESGEDKSKVLVAYSIIDADGNVNSDTNTQTQLANLVNDCLFAESLLVTQNSTIYQAKSLDNIILDSQGNMLPGERDQIKQGFKHMEQALEEKGILLSLNDDYNYRQVKRQSVIEAPAAEVARPEVSPAVVEPSSSKPEL